jgi:hypothetical protein
MDIDFEARVAKGVDLLNEHAPAEWWSADVIDLDKLDLSNVGVCVLGQVFDGYFDGLDWLSGAEGFTGPWAVDYGFILDDEEVFGPEPGGLLYHALTVAWRRAIVKIRDEVAA